MVPQLDFLCACHLDVKVSKHTMYTVSCFDIYSVSVAENFHKSPLTPVFVSEAKIHFAQGKA